MPLLGYGTYQLPESDAGVEAILSAIGLGYTLLDCATFYHNEGMVGRAVAKVDRTSVYIVSKAWNDAVYLGASAVREACLQSIKDLQCGYLDLYLIHWPVPGRHVEAYKELIQLQREGLVRDIGVSNYTIEDYEELLAAGISVIPAVNQVEVNPFLHRTRTLDYFRQRGVQIMSYRGLRNAAAFDHPVLVEIARSLNVTPAQVLGRWLVQQGICHIPKSIRKDRIESNGDLFSFALSDEHMARLAELTTAATLSTFREHYLPRLVRDTPMAVPQGRMVTLD